MELFFKSKYCFAHINGHSTCSFTCIRNYAAVSIHLGFDHFLLVEEKGSYAPHKNELNCPLAREENVSFV